MNVKLERRGGDDVSLTVEAENDSERVLLDMLMLGDYQWSVVNWETGPHPCNYQLGPASVMLRREPRSRGTAEGDAIEVLTKALRDYADPSKWEDHGAYAVNMWIGDADNAVVASGELGRERAVEALARAAKLLTRKPR